MFPDTSLSAGSRSGDLWHGGLLAGSLLSGLFPAGAGFFGRPSLLQGLNDSLAALCAEPSFLFRLGDSRCLGRRRFAPSFRPPALLRFSHALHRFRTEFAPFSTVHRRYSPSRRTAG